MKTHDGIGERLQAFVERAHLYFVATDPLSATGHLNLSPQGLDDTFAVVEEHTVTTSTSPAVAPRPEPGATPPARC